MGQPKKIKKSLSLKEKAPRRLFSYLPDIILTVDRQQRILFMNRAMDGSPPARMVGRDSALLFPKGFRAWYRRSMGRLFQESAVDNFQYSTDQSVWWDVRLLPIQRGRQVVEAMVLCSNITEKRVYQAQAIRHARLATIGVLAASIAHEVNNPNSAIAFNAGMTGRVWADCQRLLEGYFRENGDFLLGGMPFSAARSTVPVLFDEMVHNSRRVEQIIENLKSLAKHQEQMPDGMQQPSWPAVPMASSVDLHATLEASIMILNHKIHCHTDNFEFSPSRQQIVVPGNAPQLEQLFINVLLNALQSLPSRAHGVRVRTALLADTAQVVVEDQGVGVAEEQISHLTEPFFTTRLGVGGTGLGLSISNLIVRRHRGSLHFESVVGRGTTVTIRLPLESPEQPKESASLSSEMDSSNAAIPI
ncbi:MAG: PAS domain-containing protein [Magnetococcales bacterium]|nr:PAS domain-containing protein [Magnetococcales bacterium]